MSNLIGEFMGTMVLIAFGAGTVACAVLKSSKGFGGGWVSISSGWAVALTFGIFTAIGCGAPQADLNPAVTFTKWIMGVYGFWHAIATSLAQIAGAFTGATLAWLAYLPHWAETEDKALKLAIFSTGPAIRKPAANFLTEVIATFFLIFPIFVMFHTNNGVFPPGFGPFMVGLLLWGLGFAFGGPTGYAINPARDLGPRIAHAILPIAGKGSSDWGYAWIPVVAPMVGALLAYTVGCLVGIL